MEFTPGKTERSIKVSGFMENNTEKENLLFPDKNRYYRFGLMAKLFIK